MLTTYRLSELGSLIGHLIFPSIIISKFLILKSKGWLTYKELKKVFKLTVESAARYDQVGSFAF